MQPRLIRHRDAPGYLGVDRNRFDAEIRPALTEIPTGRRCIAFDRIELDEWVDAYVRVRGRPSRKTTKGAVPCELTTLQPLVARLVEAANKANETRDRTTLLPVVNGWWLGSQGFAHESRKSRAQRKTG